MSTTPISEIVEISADDLVWPFTAGQSAYPYFYPSDVSHQRVELDPFPCYAHDLREIRTALAQCEAAVYPQTWLRYYVSHFEGPARTNGFADRKHDYSDRAEDAPPLWYGMVFLAGKRIPPHPAVSRYVTAHEYGHHVQWWLDRARGADTVLDDYAVLRGLDPERPYGGGHWHAVAGEVFACDFRILGAGVEPDYWPHPGIAHPVGARALEAWWREALADLRHYGATLGEARDAA